MSATHPRSRVSPAEDQEVHGLLAAFQAGKPGAKEGLGYFLLKYARQHARALAVDFPPDQVAEIEAEVVATVFQHVDRLSEDQNLFSWVWGVTRYTVLRWRKHRRRAPVELGDPPDDRENPYETLKRKHDFAFVLREAKELGDRQAAVFELLLEGKDSAAIAAELGLPIGTVYSDVRRGREAMRQVYRRISLTVLALIAALRRALHTPAVFASVALGALLIVVSTRRIADPPPVRAEAPSWLAYWREIAVGPHMLDFPLAALYTSGTPGPRSNRIPAEMTVTSGGELRIRVVDLDVLPSAEGSWRPPEGCQMRQNADCSGPISGRYSLLLCTVNTRCVNMSIREQSMGKIFLTGYLLERGVVVGSAWEVGPQSQGRRLHDWMVFTTARDCSRYPNDHPWLVRPRHYYEAVCGQHPESPVCEVPIGEYGILSRGSTETAYVSAGRGWHGLLTAREARIDNDRTVRTQTCRTDVCELGSLSETNTYFDVNVESPGRMYLLRVPRTPFELLSPEEERRSAPPGQPALICRSGFAGNSPFALTFYQPEAWRSSIPALSVEE